MKFFSPPNNTVNAAKTRKPPVEQLQKDAITLSDGKPGDAFLESALGLFSSQQPVWIPSPEEILEMHQQQSMASMMAAIKHGSHEDDAKDTHEALTEAHILATIHALTQAPKQRVRVNVALEKEFVNIDCEDVPEGDHRVTLGVASRAIFAKSANAAKKFNIPVACFVVSIKNNSLGMVFHCTVDGAKPVNVELGEVEEYRLSKTQTALLSEQFGMQEQQARVFAGTIALQGAANTRSITSSLLEDITNRYEIDHESMMRLAISIEKWRVMQLQRHL